MTIPADILAAKAAGRIPDNVSLEYLAQSRDSPAIAGIIFLVCLTGVLMSMRLYARIFLVKRFGLDDALATFTLTLYVAFVVLCIILINLGSGRHIEYIEHVLSMTTVRQTEVLDFVAHILYTTALFTCRLSGLAFYYRLCPRSSKLHKAIIVAVPLLFATYLPQFFLLLFHCRPVTGLWPYEWQHETTDYKCLSWGLVYSVNSGVSLACDLLMFIIPSILIKQLQISREKKIKLSLVMFPGVLVIAISAIRVWLVAEGQWTSDGSWAYNPMLGIENAEIAGTLIALSVPALKPVFGNVFSRLTEYTSSHTRSRSARLKITSKPLSAVGSNTRDSKQLLQWSTHGRDDYEMMGSEVSVRPDQRSPSTPDAGKGPGIRITNEIDISREEERALSMTSRESGLT
ncbi:hypothetical protein N7474_003211 [Penicillium riverlandense]|uniref:uncharacterized protein n=1 Tax=Penicillium riverlandense TaxID=1903569 RepID=UPI0025484FAF|nr:uncharacterized protein N7474_003211 [Penicillium riverlandense]KAJ5826073.1 hypothetical protein N7474_003211 [Penicillium riverlandense]